MLKFVTKIPITALRSSSLLLILISSMLPASAVGGIDDLLQNTGAQILQRLNPQVPDTEPEDPSTKIQDIEMPRIQDFEDKSSNAFDRIEEIEEMAITEQKLKTGDAITKPKKKLSLAEASKAKRHANYLNLLHKSLTTIEEDSWTSARANLDEVVYFLAREKLQYSQDSYLEQSHKLSIAISKYAEAGYKLDIPKEVDYEAVLALYGTAQELCAEVIAAGEQHKDLAAINSRLLGYIAKEQAYIAELL